MMPASNNTENVAQYLIMQKQHQHSRVSHKRTYDSLYNKTNRSTNFPNLFWLKKNLHIFRAVPLPNIRSPLTVHLALVCLKTAWKLSSNIPVPNVQLMDSWWWAEELPETCRGSFFSQNKFGKLVHLLGLLRNQLRRFSSGCASWWTSLQNNKVSIFQSTKQSLLCWTVHINCNMRSAFSRDITQHRVEIPYRRFGTFYRFHLQGSRRWGRYVVPKQ
jgi:hypothetical protein